MTVNDVYNHLGAFVKGLIPEGEWTRAELHIEIQPGVLGMSGDSFHATRERVSLRTRYDDDLEEMIKWLHTTTTQGGHNKWNQAKFTVKPDRTFEMEFIWDQKSQDKIDGYNKKEAERDPSYSVPKWHWERI